MVGRFGTTSGLSAVSTGSQVLNLVTFVVTQFAMGITVLIARYLGEKHPEYIGQVVVGGTVVSAIIAAAQAVSVVCAVAMLLKKHLPFQLKRLISVSTASAASSWTLACRWLCRSF